MTYETDLDTNLALKDFGLVRLCVKRASNDSPGRYMSGEGWGSPEEEGVTGSPGGGTRGGDFPGEGMNTSWSMF